MIFFVLFGLWEWRRVRLLTIGQDIALLVDRCWEVSVKSLLGFVARLFSINCNWRVTPRIMRYLLGSAIPMR
ncbi:MAG: hypothetical protein ACJATP_002360 [Candidatus Azotimanducaceae bacterium]|jgi:hypothetical protein